MKLVFTGIQGCGKGTQARLLVENYGFKLVEMGQEFRDTIKSGSELGKEIKKVIDAGHLVSDQLGAKVMGQALEKYKDEDRVIFDAFIRLDWNKRVFDEYISDYKVVFFDLSEKKAKQRLLGRMYNPKTGETFPSNIITDPKTGDELIKRKDDNEESFLTRIEAFITTTLPIVFLQKKEGKVIEICADHSIEEVHAHLVNKLGL